MVYKSFVKGFKYTGYISGSMTDKQEKAGEAEEIQTRQEALNLIEEIE